MPKQAPAGSSAVGHDNTIYGQGHVLRFLEGFRFSNRFELNKTSHLI